METFSILQHQKACPEMGAIRFHAYENETSAIRRQEQALATENNTEDKTEDSSGAGFASHPGRERKTITKRELSTSMGMSLA